MIHQTEEGLKLIRRLSKSTEQHMKDIMRLKQDCKLAAEEFIAKRFQDQDLEQDLQMFAAAYGFTFEEQPACHVNPKKRQARKSITQTMDMNQQTMSKLLQRLRQNK